MRIQSSPAVAKPIGYGDTAHVIVTSANLGEQLVALHCGGRRSGPGGCRSCSPTVCTTAARASAHVAASAVQVCEPNTSSDWTRGPLEHVVRASPAMRGAIGRE